MLIIKELNLLGDSYHIVILLDYKRGIHTFFRKANI